MKRELAKDRELSFGIQDFLDSRTEIREPVSFLHCRLEKYERGGGAASYKLRPDRACYRRCRVSSTVAVK